ADRRRGRDRRPRDGGQPRPAAREDPRAARPRRHGRVEARRRDPADADGEAPLHRVRRPLPARDAVTAPRGGEGPREEGRAVATPPSRVGEVERLLSEWQGEARAARRRAWLARNPDGPALAWTVDAPGGAGLAATTAVFPRR